MEANALCPASEPLLHLANHRPEYKGGCYGRSPNRVVVIEVNEIRRFESLEVAKIWEEDAVEWIAAEYGEMGGDEERKVEDGHVGGEMDWDGWESKVNSLSIRIKS